MHLKQWLQKVAVVVGSSEQRLKARGNQTWKWLRFQSGLDTALTVLTVLTSSSVEFCSCFEYFFFFLFCYLLLETQRTTYKRVPLVRSRLIGAERRLSSSPRSDQQVYKVCLLWRKSFNTLPLPARHHEFQLQSPVPVSSSCLQLPPVCRATSERNTLGKPSTGSLTTWNQWKPVGTQCPRWVTGSN